MFDKINETLNYIRENQYSSDKLFNPPTVYDKYIYKTVLCIFLTYTDVPSIKNPETLYISSLDENDYIKKWCICYGYNIQTMAEFVTESQHLQDNIAYKYQVRLIPRTTMISMDRNDGPNYIKTLLCTKFETTVLINPTQKLCKFHNELILYKEENRVENRKYSKITQIHDFSKIYEHLIAAKSYESMALIKLPSFIDYVEKLLIDDVPNTTKMTAIDLYCHAIQIPFIEKPAQLAITLNLNLMATIDMIKSHTLSIDHDVMLPDFN